MLMAVVRDAGHPQRGGAQQAEDDGPVPQGKLFLSFFNLVYAYFINFCFVLSYFCSR